MKRRYHLGWNQRQPVNDGPRFGIECSYSVGGGEMRAVVDAESLSEAREIVQRAFGIVSNWLFFQTKPRGWRPDRSQLKPAKRLAA